MLTKLGCMAAIENISLMKQTVWWIIIFLSIINYKLENPQNLICLNALKSKIPLKHNFQTYDSRKSSKLESCDISEEHVFCLPIMFSFLYIICLKLI